MTQEMLIMAAILVAVILLTFIGILSRYRKCKSDEVLVVSRWSCFRMADYTGLRIPFHETIAD